MKVNFDNLRPEERRIILVASDSTYKNLTNKVDYFKTLFFLTPGGYLHIISVLLGKYLANSTYLTPVWENMHSISKQSWFGQMFTKKREILTPHLSPTEAINRFKFDLGGPVDGTAYILNPCIKDHYLLPAIANERMAQEKLVAFKRIAESLGAKTIIIESGELIQKSMEGNASLSLADSAAQIGINANFSSSGTVERCIYAQYDQPKKAPFCPAELESWLIQEPLLRSLVDGRLKANQMSTKLVLKFTDAIDVYANATGELAGKGINVGGSYKDVIDSSWSLDIEFWPKMKK